MDLLDADRHRDATARTRAQAEYWSVRVGDSVHADLAWSYRTPLPESQKIAGLVAFYNEKVDSTSTASCRSARETKFSA